MALLESVGLSKRFGGLMALNNVDLHVNPGEILGLIGPNGAGKTTFFNVITGFLRASGGRVLFNGGDITNLKPYDIARKGIARSFQLAVLFQGLSVLDNVLVALHQGSRLGFWNTLFSTPVARRENRLLPQRAADLLRLVGLSERATEQAQALPCGHQKYLSLAMALALNPQLLLLDEPARGLNVGEAAQLMGIVKTLRGERGITTIIVEHNMRVIMEHCDRIVVLNYGNKIADGPPGEIAENRAVIEAYLGTRRYVA